MEESTCSNIPKIIHQIWIGPKPMPFLHMNGWQQMHPDFEYIRWTEAEFQERNIRFECQHRIDEMEEWAGKADIMRWELLYRYGGVFLDADSICVSPIDDVLMKCESFAGWEQEQCRKGLIATGTMGFPPRHPLVKAAVDWIKNNCVDVRQTKNRAWQSVGPMLLTRLYHTGQYPTMTIFPSFFFLPVHYTGAEYHGHGKIYAYQEWGSTKQNYDTMNSMSLPGQFTPPSPETSISVLVCSFNTPAAFLAPCLQSIQSQEGHFHIELVWVNDGSDAIHTQILRNLLTQFEQSCRFVKVVYSENGENRGLGYSLNKGVCMCRHEIILRMDSDDIMVNTRCQTQFQTMTHNSHIQLAGGQIRMFEEGHDNIDQTNHPSISWNQYNAHPRRWFINHPTWCFRKSAVLDVGNYNESLTRFEDFDLAMRMLKRYGFIYNSPDVLVYHRVHTRK
jgi:hypothetical protein